MTKSYRCVNKSKRCTSKRCTSKRRTSKRRTSKRRNTTQVARLGVAPHKSRVSRHMLSLSGGVNAGVHHPSVPSHHPSVPSHHPSVPSHHTIIPSHHTGVPSHNPSVPSHNPGVPSNNPGVPSSHHSGVSGTVNKADKVSNWTKAGRALMYGVGASGTGLMTGYAIGHNLPTKYTEKDLEDGGKFNLEFLELIEIKKDNFLENKYLATHRNGGEQFYSRNGGVEFYRKDLEVNGRLYNEWQQKKRDITSKFLREKNEEVTKDRTYKGMLVGAALAAAAAGTYGATRRNKEDKAVKTSNWTRAGRAVTYGIGALGTGALTGIIPSIENQKKNALIGAGLAAVAAGTYGATRD